MANAEHIRLLKQGAEIWNRWRALSGNTRPELSEADLSWAEIGPANLNGANLARARLRGARLNDADLYRAELFEADLSAANLTTADLTGAHLKQANLSSAELRWAELIMANLYKADLRWADLKAAHLFRADLTAANLEEADLCGANLREANLFGANLRGADLRWADLRQTDLREANLSEAHLSGVEFTGARVAGAIFTASDLAYVIFGDLDLSAARGLDAVHHLGPSTVGLDTVSRSQGRIPDVFLRGCGVPDEVIALVHWLEQNPVRPHACLISYASTEQRLAERLHEDLQERNVRCWLSPDRLKTGKARLGLNEAIRIDDRMILILSETSAESDWIGAEVEQALVLEQEDRRRVLHAIETDNIMVRKHRGWAERLKERHEIADFRRWQEPEAYREAFEPLLVALLDEGPS